MTTLDARVLSELKKMHREGRASATVKQLMKRIGAPHDSVKYLGALERVRGAYHKWAKAQR